MADKRKGAAPIGATPSRSTHGGGNQVERTVPLTPAGKKPPLVVEGLAFR